MRTVFADTFFFLAQLNPKDEAHLRSVNFTSSYHDRMLTTDWVIVELGDAFAHPPNRRVFIDFFNQLQSQTKMSIVPSGRELLESGLRLYANRLDKDWSLTDCISFVVMQRERITEALTADHHFEQAGFTALLK